MPNVDEILSEPEIKDFIETNRNAAGRIKRAAECLAGQADKSLSENIAALKKLLPALADQVISVFFSYKKTDERAASTIVEVLRQNAAGKLNITYQSEFGQALAGREWRQYIIKEVRRANWFILLLPDPSDELAWCLFETGLFEAQLTSADRLICLHHPDTAVPNPIKDYQAIAATLPDVENFLQMVYIKGDPVFGLPPINPAIENLIPAIAQRVVNAIRVPRGRLNRQIFEPWIEIRHERAKMLHAKEDLDSATVAAENKEALKLFGLIERKNTFAELREGIEENRGDSRWREELFHVIRKIANGKAFSPIQAVLHAQDGKIYRPVALAVDRVGPGGPIDTYHITFAEDVSTADTAAMPDKLATLATLLRITFRFRWEVLEPFATGPLSEEDVARLDVNLRRIKADWESRGSFDQNVIMELFTGDQKRRLVEMFATWGQLRNPDGNGELDIAIKNKDGQAVPALLAKVLLANQEFLEMAAERFAEMVKPASPT